MADHSYLSYYLSVALQNFVIDNTTCSQPGVFDGENASLLNEVLCEHLFRQGRLDIAEQLIEVRQYVESLFLSLFLLQLTVSTVRKIIYFSLPRNSLQMQLG